MQDKKIEAIRAETKRGYDDIAEQFSHTRKYVWPDMESWRGFLSDDMTILDAGCGTGRFLQLCKDRRVQYYGVDVSVALLQIARRECSQYSAPQVTFQAADITALPFSDQMFDVVGCVATLHHLPSAELRWRAVTEFARVLKPGGKLLMNNWYLLNHYADHKYHISRQLVWNRWRGVERGGVFIPWRNSQGRVAARRYYYAFRKPEIVQLLERAGLIVERNQITNRRGSQDNEEIGFESIVTEAHKPEI